MPLDGSKLDAFCLKCGYSLRGVTERCPECGTPFDLSEPRSFYDPDIDERGPLELIAILGALPLALSLVIAVCFETTFPGISAVAACASMLTLMLQPMVLLGATFRLLALHRCGRKSRTIWRAWLISFFILLLFGLFAGSALLKMFPLA